MKQPKYKYGDLVRFQYGEDILTGIVHIIDAYGTIEQHDEPSYDIYIEANNTLYKHIRESQLLREDE